MHAAPSAADRLAHDLLRDAGRSGRARGGRDPVVGQPARPPIMLYRIPDVATALGISRSACYELVECGVIAHVRIGRRKLIPKQALDAYLADLLATASPRT
jgi:excisionase family DNA binding protein